MTIPRLTPPLARCRLTQPFGVDWIGGGFYTKYGLKGHNGIDLEASDDTPVYACFDGVAFTDSNDGYGNDLRIRSKELGLEAVYGHLKSFGVKNGQEVTAGQLVAKSDNTGLSTGPHLHFGLRRCHWLQNGAGPYFDGYDNGYKSSIDPQPFFDPDIFKFPVELGYGVNPVSVAEFAPAFLYFIRTTRRIPTFMEYRALRWGRWDLRSVLDPTMFMNWREMTKMEYVKK